MRSARARAYRPNDGSFEPAMTARANGRYRRSLESTKNNGTPSQPLAEDHAGVAVAAAAAKPDVEGENREGRNASCALEPGRWAWLPPLSRRLDSV